ncbi:MAG: hypothetical protein R3291_01000, partial [Thermoplasmata archaeon]|nr:hypothetical protein [Thermoplasmata archaeon]
MAERTYQKLGWIILLIVSVIFALFGLGDIIGATSVDPAIVEGITGLTPEELGAISPEALHLANYMTRALGGALLIVGLLAAAVAWTAFRRGERWAWYALLTLPLLNVLIFVLMYTHVDFSTGVLPPPL